MSHIFKPMTQNASTEHGHQWKKGEKVVLDFT